MTADRRLTSCARLPDAYHGRTVRDGTVDAFGREGAGRVQVFDAPGPPSAAFAVGDAVEHLLTDASGDPWAGHFDEGVCQDPPSEPGRGGGAGRERPCGSTDTGRRPAGSRSATRSTWTGVSSGRTRTRTSRCSRRARTARCGRGRRRSEARGAWPSTAAGSRCTAVATTSTTGWSSATSVTAPSNRRRRPACCGRRRQVGRAAARRPPGTSPPRPGGAADGVGRPRHRVNPRRSAARPRVVSARVPPPPRTVPRSPRRGGVRAGRSPGSCRPAS
ncbi:hypothetical protein SGRIM128S_05224 [Streptomyces griseomycini]